MMTLFVLVACLLFVFWVDVKQKRRQFLKAK